MWCVEVVMLLLLVAQYSFSRTYNAVVVWKRLAGCCTSGMVSGKSNVCVDVWRTMHRSYKPSSTLLI